MKSRGKKKIFGGYTNYSFKEKDPSIDEVQTLWQDAGSPSFQEISEKTGLSASTPYEWFFGKTRKPNNCSLQSFGKALGYHRPWRKMPAGMK